MKFKISATTFNGLNINPEIEIFANLGEKNNILSTMVYSDIEEKIKDNFGEKISFYIVSKDLENLKNQDIKVDSSSLIDIVYKLVAELIKNNQTQIQTPLKNQQLLRVIQFFDDKDFDSANEILKNIDSILHSHAKALKKVAGCFNGYPLIIGENTCRERLVGGIIYERFEIPAMNLDTFEMVLDGYDPKAFRDKGGFYTEIDPIKLRNARKEKKLTQKELAKLVGVSTKTIYMHEKKCIRAEVEVAEKIEKILGKNIRKNAVFKKPVGFASERPRNELENFIQRKMQSIGMQVSFASHAPYDVLVCSEEEKIISEAELNKRRIYYRYKTLKEFAEFFESRGVVFTEKFRGRIEVPVILKKELEEIESKKDFISLVEEKMENV